MAGSLVACLYVFALGCILCRNLISIIVRYHVSASSSFNFYIPQYELINSTTSPSLRSSVSSA